VYGSTRKEASMASTLTPDEVTDLKKKLANEKAKLPAGGTFCQKWPEVKTVLQFLHDLPVMPQKVKAAIETVISAGDAAYSVICKSR
jgi:hypothetical protein